MIAAMDPMVETKTDNGPGVPRRRMGSAGGRLLRSLGWTTAVLGAGGALVLACGFLWFIWRLPSEEATLHRNADGIVALTGGSARITDAIELLAAGHGRRLLISGANRNTNFDEISRLNPDFDQWVRCCVDFDRSLNTLGNAIETRHWAERRGFRSLIVVTSNYHMPRAMAEIAHQLPDVTLVPFSVVSERLRTEPWWKSSAIVKLMFSEYMKYMVARLRIRLTPAVAAIGRDSKRPETG